MVMGDGTFYLQCHLFIVCSISTVCCMSSVWGCGNALLKPLAGRGDNSLAVGDGSWGFGGVWVVGWGVLGPPSYLFFQMAFAAVSILRVFQLLSSCQVALRKLGAAFIECRDPGLTLEVGGKSGAASKHFDTVAAAELLVAGNYKDKIYHCLLPHIGGLQLALGSPSETPRKPSLASNFYFFNLRQVQCEPSIFIARWINEFLLGTSSALFVRDPWWTPFQHFPLCISALSGAALYPQKFKFPALDVPVFTENLISWQNRWLNWGGRGKEVTWRQYVRDWKSYFQLCPK